MLSLEASQFDMQAEPKLEVAFHKGKKMNQLLIEKKLEKAKTVKRDRKSRDHQLVRDQIIKPLIKSMEVYYGKFVNGYAPTLNVIQENEQMLNFIGREESRIRYYIHSEDNVQTYIQALN